MSKHLFKQLASLKNDQEICLYLIAKYKEDGKISKKLRNLLLSSGNGYSRYPELEMFYQCVLVEGDEMSEQQLIDLYDAIPYEQCDGFFSILKNNLEASNVINLIKTCCKSEIFLACLYETLDHCQITKVATLLHDNGLLSYKGQISEYLEHKEEIYSEGFDIVKLLSELAGIDIKEIVSDYEVVGHYLDADV